MDQEVPIITCKWWCCHLHSDQLHASGKHCSCDPHRAGVDAARSFATGCFATHRTHDLRGLSEAELKVSDHVLCGSGSAFSGWTLFFIFYSMTCIRAFDIGRRSLLNTRSTSRWEGCFTPLSILRAQFRSLAIRRMHVHSRLRKI